MMTKSHGARASPPVLRRPVCPAPCGVKQQQARESPQRGLMQLLVRVAEVEVEVQHLPTALGVDLAAGEVRFVSACAGQSDRPLRTMKFANSLLEAMLSAGCRPAGRPARSAHSTSPFQGALRLQLRQGTRDSFQKGAVRSTGCARALLHRERGPASTCGA